MFVSMSLLIILSLILSYLLIFDNNLILSRWSNQSEAQVNIQNDSNSQITDYYNLARLRLSDVIYPTRLIISSDQQAYVLHDQETLKDLATLLAQRRVTMTGTLQEPSEEAYINLITQERVELEFSTLQPFELTDHFIKNESDVTTFSFNRIIFPKTDNKSQVYLVNSITHQYMEANLPDGTQSSDYFLRVQQVEDQWVPSTRYSLGNGSYVYLPDEQLVIKSQVYTLNRVPEANVIQSLFGNSRSWRYDSSDQNEGNRLVTYYNANLEAGINLSNQMVTVAYKNATLYEASSQTQKLEQAFNQIRQFEYWTQGLRIASNSDATNIIFQRYLNGFPIFTMPNMTQYSLDRTVFRTISGVTSINRVLTPMLYLEAHVHDHSRDYELASTETILYELNVAGFDISDFSNVVIGYEWQSDMADFQRVNFVPRWYFEKDGSYYSLSQIMDGAINQQTGLANTDLQEEGSDGF